MMLIEGEHPLSAVQYKPCDGCYMMQCYANQLHVEVADAFFSSHQTVAAPPE